MAVNSYQTLASVNGAPQFVLASTSSVSVVASVVSSEALNGSDARPRVAGAMQPASLAVIARERILGIDRGDDHLAAPGEEQHRLEAR